MHALIVLLKLPCCIDQTGALTRSVSLFQEQFIACYFLNAESLIWVWHWGSVSGTVNKSRGLLQSISCHDKGPPFLSSTGTKATIWSDWSHPEFPHVWAELCYHCGCQNFSHSNSESIQEQGCSLVPSCPCPLWITFCTYSFWNSKMKRIHFKKGFRTLFPEEK